MQQAPRLGQLKRRLIAFFSPLQRRRGMSRLIRSSRGIRRHDGDERALARRLNLQRSLRWLLHTKRFRLLVLGRFSAGGANVTSSVFDCTLTVRSRCVISNVGASGGYATQKRFMAALRFSSAAR
jgi:hypothetical protein